MKRQRRLLIIECFIKNALLGLLLWLITPLIRDDLTALDPSVQANVLTVTGLLLAGSVAGTFAFSYEKTNLHTWVDRWFGHLTTFFLNFGIGLMIEIALFALAATPGPHNAPVTLVALFVFTSVILYDFWNVLRVAHQS